MKIYIRSTGNISPQKTFGHQPFLAERVVHTGSRLNCIEPDYKGIIDTKLIRRMSRIIKMGVAAALDCLQGATPDAIITGTAYGCLEDTEIFLKKLLENNEEMLTPTAFIQSTHNTVGAQIALLLSCHNYNNTFVHRGFSFENALLDAKMMMLENAAKNVLVGSVDEITEISHAVQSRFGLYKKDAMTTDELFNTSSRGTFAGEGASFFLLSNEQRSGDNVCFDAFEILYKPASFSEVQNFITSFLKSNFTEIADIDLIIIGKNGDAKGDLVYKLLSHSIFTGKTIINYKDLCGEYPTATSFALWMATNIIQEGTIPASLNVNTTIPKKILVYNHYQNIHHSLFLISAC